MAKIPKNLSDKDMLKGWQDDESAEALFLSSPAGKETARTRPSAPKREEKRDRVAYITPDVVDSLEKALLELKVSLYREGIVDFKMNVCRKGNDIILSPVETGAK